MLKDGGHAREGSEDDRFLDYFGTLQSIVTSSSNNDSGMFETNLRDERFLPFEGAGAESTWKLELRAAFQQFDYNTISDVILHMRYTARQAGQLREPAVARIEELVKDANTSGHALLFSLQHDFSSEWHRFTAPGSTENFTAKVKRDYFPYFTQGQNITIHEIQLQAIQNDQLKPLTPDLNDEASRAELTEAFKEKEEFELSLPADSAVLVQKKDAQVFVLIKYSVG